MRPRSRGWIVSLGLASCALPLGACTNNDLMPALSELCVRDDTLPCGNAPDGGAPTGLVGQRCPRGSRPDLDPTYSHGVPAGLVCGETGPMAGDGSQGYCCSQGTTTCAYNPASTCPLATYSIEPTGLQVVPVVDSPGTGLIRMTFNQKSTLFSAIGSFANLSSQVTAIHIHGPADLGQSGSVLVDIALPAGATNSGNLDYSTPLGTVTASQLGDMINGITYLDIHTQMYPDGEVRAQILPSVTGFQCRGGNRPEALNPLIDCGNGVREGDLINYCCTSRPVPLPPLGAGCVQSDGQCTGKFPEWLPDRMSGWTCTDGTVPAAEDFKANESRADFFYFMCGTPTPAPNPRVMYYCCIVPPLVQEGGSCYSHMSVPGCGANRWGFACYGRDTPEEDYTIMTCPSDSNFTQAQPGISMEGYPAKLYCCDLKACEPEAVPGCATGRNGFACFGDRPETNYPRMNCPDPPVLGMATPSGRVPDLYCCDLR